MKFGVCASYRQIGELAAIPCDYLEEGVQRFLIPEQPREDFEEQWHRARAVPIPIEAANMLLPKDAFLVATADRPVDKGRLERYMKTALERAGQVGIRVVVFGSGAVRACPPGHDPDDARRQLGEHLATWSAWARECGVRIVLEPLRYEETNMLNTVAESGALVQGIAASGAGLLADLYHMACNGEDPASVVPWASLLCHVHVAEREGRTPPGQHGDDFRPYFAALREAGYDHRISIECGWQDFEAELGPAIATLRSQWAASGA